MLRRSNGHPAVVRFLLRGRDADDVTPPGLPSQKTARVVWGVYFLTAPPVWGRGTPGVVVGVAQNGTVGCEKVHSRRVTTNLGES